MLPPVSRREWLWAVAAAALIILLASVPYLVGMVITPEGYSFTGLLINPIDGHSYLAKMGQGARGSWAFRLPYTAEDHKPAFMFTYHLALGHLAPDSSPETLILIYHLARVVFGLFLLLAVYGAAAFLTSDVRQRRLTLLFVGLTSGLGWLFGSGADLTVPEAVTFSSLLVNAHFGLTSLLMLLTIVGLTLAPRHWGWLVIITLGTVCLTMIQPLAPIVVGLTAGIWIVIRFLRERRVPWHHVVRLVAFSCCSVPLLLYYVWVMQTNPHLGRWMDQNVTPSPPAWEWLVAYGFLWPLAAAGVWRIATRERRAPADLLVLAWLVVQLVLMLIPMSLQRRLSTGLHLPLCFLAAMGLVEGIAPRIRGRARRYMVPALFLVMIPTSLLLVLAGVSAVASKNPYVVLSDVQWEAMEWLQQNADPETIVLADEELGTIVPAWGGGARVLYGHPFETLDADEMRTTVTRFYTGAMPAEARTALLDRWNVGYIVLQTDRYELSSVPGYVSIWQSGPIIILSAEDT